MVSPSILHTSSLLPGGGNPETVAKTPWQYCNLCLPYSKQARTNQSTISLKLSDQKCFLFQSSQQPTEDFLFLQKFLITKNVERFIKVSHLSKHTPKGDAWYTWIHTIFYFMFHLLFLPGNPPSPQFFVLRLRL